MTVRQASMARKTSFHFRLSESASSIYFYLDKIIKTQEFSMSRD